LDRRPSEPTACLIDTLFLGMLASTAFWSGTITYREEFSLRLLI
jgi:hypothetical protein